VLVHAADALAHGHELLGHDIILAQLDHEVAAAPASGTRG